MCGAHVYNVLPMFLGVDVGGTFTDAVLAFDGRLGRHKASVKRQHRVGGTFTDVDAQEHGKDVINMGPAHAGPL